MRTPSALLHYTQVSRTTTYKSVTAIQHAVWHSPALYLFGGLAAVLVSIAFAVLIMACSSSNQTEDQGNTDAEKGMSSSTTKASPVFEQKLYVIMAGQERPTFLATPISVRTEATFPLNDEQVHSKGKENIEKKPQSTQENGEES